LSTLVFIIGGFLIWKFYFQIDESELQKLETKIESNKEVNKYLADEIFFIKAAPEEADVVSYKGLKSYPYNFTSHFNDDFNKLSVEEKYNVFTKIVELIEEDHRTTLIECGYKKYCSIDKITLFNTDMIEKTNTFTFDIDDKEITHLYDDEGRFKSEVLSNTDTLKTSNSNNTNGNSLPKLEFVESSARIDGDYIYVTGAIKNNSNISYTYVEIKVTYFDENGNILDTDNAYLNSSDLLMPNERKSFSIMTQMVGQKYPKYKVQIFDYKISD